MAIKLGNSHSNKRSARQPRFSEINVTPMVDVMLVLLVIFMVTAPMMTTGVTVDLPDANAAAVAGQDEPLTVAVQADGRVYIGKTEVAPKDLGKKLKAITGEKKDTRIFVRGDQSVDYGKVMQAMVEVSNAGFTKVALLTEAKGTDNKGR